MKYLYMADDNRGWRGDPEGHAKAGKKGGDTTASEHGSEFYEDIGSEGGSKSGTQGSTHNSGNFAEDRDRASREGKRGGQASSSNN